MAEAAAAEGVSDRAAGRRNSDVFQAAVRQARTSPSTGSSAPPTPTTSRRPRSSGSGCGDAGDIYLGTYSGWYSMRDESFCQRRRDRVEADGTRVAVDSGAPVTWTEEETYFFRLVGVHRQTARPLRGAPGVHRTGRAAQRGRQLRLRWPARLLDLPHDVRLGRAGARPPRPRHVRLGGRADELPYRRGLSGHRLGDVPPVLAGRSAHDRQGHHPVSHRVLAGVSDVGRNRAAPKGFRARPSAQPWRRR